MYHIGNCLFHPAHGITEVQAITSMNFDGEDKKFYVLHSVNGSSQFFVPVDNAEKVGLRTIIGPPEVAAIVQLMSDETPVEELPWRERHRRHLEKVSTGQPILLAEVVRELSYQDREKRLPATSQRLLDRARQLLVEEIAYVTKQAHEEVEKTLGLFVT